MDSEYSPRVMRSTPREIVSRGRRSLKERSPAERVVKAITSAENSAALRKTGEMSSRRKMVETPTRTSSGFCPICTGIVIS